jgi:hypothetical protein
MNDDQDSKIKRAVETAKLAGVSATTVEDGHVLIFTRQKLEELLEAAKSTEREMVIVVVKRPDFQAPTPPRITH